MVTAEGVAITLVFESLCNARIIAAKFTPLLAMRPRPNVVPEGMPTSAAPPGSSTARARSTRFTPATGLRNPPTGILVSLSLDQTAQFTPSSAFLLTLTSTMMASTSTCMRRMSSLSMMAMSERITFCGAVMISALVSGSAQMVVERSALADTPPPA
jgi:hypothetical protein